MDTNCLEQYRNSETKWEHTALIKQRYSYQEFHSQPEHWKLVRWLYQRSTLSPESPSVLFDLTTARLAERKILLPGVSVLAGAAFIWIPGVGPTLIIGHLASTALLGGIEGAVAGAVGGGVLGTLTGWGISAQHVLKYEDKLKDGK
ncbi:DUF4158 domain-containing protein [Chlorogloeopsis sp. ULAP01]|uniref:DUF4158 domain-containing protein n=1 Tax=Chlorogloeopsis sp. ULAP01 TaxID=3056483 RepID=UPI0025AA7CB0|nr:DUF4158 domain-containing protein [Chlorogloeopsis sp. ULAP01]MDM9384703.1 DUF4158 domain-containing protein [Chlorogloeopsis sp. ULAP01]